MQHLSVIVAQKEPADSERLARQLRRQLFKVGFAHSHVAIHDALHKSGAQAVVVDLELIGFDQLRRLCQNSLGATVIATHRSPDDEMWMDCLAIGAADCCHKDDVDGILRAIAMNTHVAHAWAA